MSQPISDELFLLCSDGKNLPLAILPASRSLAFDLVKKAWTGPGKYSFTRVINNPEHEKIELTCLTVTTYLHGELGITALALGSTISATSRDITLYLQEACSWTKDTPVRLSLDIYEDASERNTAWLNILNSSGSCIAEFGLRPTGALNLPQKSKPEARADFLYELELPSCRSIFRFVSIACELFHCGGIQINPIPLNSRSTEWFS